MNKFAGKTKFYGKRVNFEIEDFYLTLFVDGDISQKLMYSELANGTKLMVKQPLKIKELSCITNDGLTKVVCYFDKLSYSGQSKTMYLGDSTIKIPLKKLIVFNLSKTVNKYYMIFFSKELHMFTELVPRFKPINSGNDRSIVLDLNFSSLNLISKFKLSGHNIELKPTYKYKIQGSSIDFTPGLKLTFDKELNEKEIDKFYTTLIKFVHYCSMRTNIEPESFAFCNGVHEGEIHSYFGLNKIDNEDLCSIYRDSFSWSILSKKAANLFKLIFNNKIHLLHNHENRISRLAVSFESVSKDAAAFEYEFDSLYPSGMPYSNERATLETEVVGEITPLMEKSSGKKRKIYKSLIKNVHIQSLGDKIEFCLDKYSKFFKTTMQNFNIRMNHEEIGEHCRSIRNDVDHGNKIEKISDDEAASFIVLRCLIYAIQLKKAKFNQNEVNSLINCLYSIKGAPR